MVWNKGLTKKTDARLAEHARKHSATKLKLFAEGRLVPHNKGKTRANYAPLARVGDKVSGSANGMHGAVSWNSGLTKLSNPDLITYGVSKEKHWNWKGGVDRHELDTLSWRKTRKSIRRRDSYTCRLCGCDGKDVHHKVPYRISRDNSDDNLVTLCKKCHTFCDRMYDMHTALFEDIVRTAQKCAEELGNKFPPGEFLRLLKQQIEGKGCDR